MRRYYIYTNDMRPCPSCTINHIPVQIIYFAVIITVKIRMVYIQFRMAEGVVPQILYLENHPYCLTSLECITFLTSLIFKSVMKLHAIFDIDIFVHIDPVPRATSGKQHRH